MSHLVTYKNQLQFLFLASTLTMLTACGTGFQAAGTASASSSSSNGSGSNLTNGSFSPASHTALPKVVFGGGPVMNNAILKAVTFAGDAWASQINDFVAKYAVSQELYASIAEYVQGSSVAAASPAMLSQAAAANYTQSSLESWLSTTLHASGSPLGAPSDRTIYILYFPVTTKISLDTTFNSCTEFAGYHDSYVDSQSGLTIHYAIIARCQDSQHTDTINDASITTNHEVVESITDPDHVNNGYLGVDDNSLAWFTALGAEVGDLCDYKANHFTPADVGYSITKTWSNAAAAAGHDPCVTHDSGSVYFNSAPVLPDSVSYMDPTAQTQFTTKGVKIPVGSSKTITLQLFSDAPTSGQWQVQAVDATDTGGRLSFQFDQTMGSNGSMIHLTVSVNSQDPTMKAEMVYITSKLGSKVNFWPLIIGN